MYVAGQTEASPQRLTHLIRLLFTVEIKSLFMKSNPLIFFFLHSETFTSRKLSSRPCFSLSEPQHLRKTHHRPQHDDVMCRLPAAFGPDHRWQCGALEAPREPCQPTSTGSGTLTRVHEVTGSLLLLIHVVVVLPCCC